MAKIRHVDCFSPANKPSIVRVNATWGQKKTRVARGKKLKITMYFLTAIIDTDDNGKHFIFSLPKMVCLSAFHQLMMVHMTNC